MKQTDKRRGPNTKDKSRSAGPNTRDHKLQEKKASRNFKQEEIDAKTSSYKLKNNMVGSNLKIGAEPSEAFENVVIDYVDDAYKTEEAVNNSRTVKMDEIQCNEKLSDNSSDMDVVDESDAETTNDSVSSHGDSQTADEDKAEKVTQAKSDSSGADSNSQAERSKSDGKTNNQHAKAPKTPNKGSSKGLSKSSVMSSADNLKNMKVHPKPPSDSSEEADGQPPNEQDNRVDSLGEASSGAHEVSSDDKAVSTENNDRQEDNTSLDQKIEEMETRIKNLESELREVAALEISIYSVVPEHSSSAHKVHTPARRLSRLYIYACKYWSQDKRATVARNTISGLVIVSKSCGNDVSRLTFWLSNTVVLREIISQAFGSSCHSSSLAKVFESSGGELKTSASKARNSGSRQLNKQGFLQFVDDWQETRTFTAALEKVESWMFTRIVESIWWQTLTPNMQSPLGNSAVVEGSERLLGPALGDQKQGSFSINLWKSAFHEALKRLCPVRAGGHECGCLPALARKVMEQCLGRLDVAMFNAILRESAHEIPTDPVSDPIVDSKVLPVPAGYLSFGSGAQLKNSVGNWTRWLSDFIGTNIDSSAKDENKTLDDDDIRGIEEPKGFPLLNGLSDLLMLPKDMLMDRTVRMEVCPSISLTLVKRILCNFSPDEFCPDPVPGAVLEALNAECIIERRLSGDSTITFPYTAAPAVYKPPSSSDVAEKVAEVGGIHQLSRSASAVQRKGYTSDEELDELKYCLYSVIHRLPSSPTAHVSGDQQDGEGYDEGNARYDLLREVWQYT